jgi:hypothetical protein
LRVRNRDIDDVVVGDSATIGVPSRDAEPKFAGRPQRPADATTTSPVGKDGHVRWEISANLGSHARAGVEAHGWLWQIARGDQVAEVLIEITKTAWSSDPLRLPADTRHAVETDGRSEVLKVLAQDDPPSVVHCGSKGCRPSRT